MGLSLMVQGIDTYNDLMVKMENNLNHGMFESKFVDNIIMFTNFAVYIFKNHLT